jgi:hypothetical protein
MEDVEFFPALLSERWFKVAVFVPGNFIERVHRAMSRAGAGALGRYDSCAFVTPGKGMFRPLEGSRPTIGKKGRMEHVEEERLEMLVEDKAVAGVIDALKEAHPYEEVAYDVFPLRLPEAGGAGYLGTLQGTGLGTLARRLGRKLGAEARVSGKPKERIRKAAVVPGSGGSYLETAAENGAQVLITGEVRYHQMLEAEHLGVGIIELGHDRSEMPAVDIMARGLRKKLGNDAGGVGVYTFKRPKAARTYGEAKWNRR